MLKRTRSGPWQWMLGAGKQGHASSRRAADINDSEPTCTRLHNAALLSALVVGYLIGSWVAAPSRYHPEHRKVFVLAVFVTFEKQNDRDVWIGHWTKMADHVRANEPNTLSYELSIADNHPLKVLVYERYKSKMDMIEVHQKSKLYWEFKKLRQHLPFNVTVGGQSYYETNIGFM